MSRYYISRVAWSSHKPGCRCGGWFEDPRCVVWERRFDDTPKSQKEAVRVAQKAGR